MTSSVRQTAIRLHLTNVTGVGASQLLQSLLPALEQAQGFDVERIDLPDHGVLSSYIPKRSSTIFSVYRRWLPNALSRLLECTLLAVRFNGNTPLLVLGDIPLRCNAVQTVFVQQANLLSPVEKADKKNSIKYTIAKFIFRLNMARVRAFIVQTEVMRASLERSYPGVSGRVHVISQPVPSWLLHSGLRRKGRCNSGRERLRLIYPAAGYLHKNHALLAKLKEDWPIEQLTLTLDCTLNPAPQLSWIRCSGFLSPQGMVSAYAEVDALLFLSQTESYGFPLVEAMFVGLPIVCPDLPYARALCGEEAIYFDSHCPVSLRKAIDTLQARLISGWWPDWGDRLRGIPESWDDVADSFLRIATSSTKPHKFLD